MAAARTTCAQGHDLTDPANVWVSPSDSTNRQCRTCMRENSRDYYYANREAQLAQQREHYQANHARVRADVKAQRAKLRDDALAAYGTACAECGSTERLELDHVNGDGRLHREQVGEGWDFYRWLRNNGYPNDPPLQVLCRRCHKAKSVEERRRAAA